MTIILDVRSTGIESAYVERPFDEAKAELEADGFNIISLEQLAELRIAQGRGSHVANYGCYVKEGFLYVPQKGIFLVRDSPIMDNAEKATNCHRAGKEFYLTQEQVEESLVNSVQFKDASPISTNGFAEDERTAFAFGSSAGEYGEFLKEAGAKEMPVYLANPKKKPFVRQAWLHLIVDDYWSGLYGNGRCLYCGDAVRGVRRVVAEGVAPKNEAPLAPQEIAQEKQVVTLERMLELSRPHVSDFSWSVWVQTLQKEYKQ